MIDSETWVLLADRCAEIQRLRELEEQPEEDLILVFDAHDQARVVKR